ncbi:MAG: hypothetical protein MN733_41715 [Nitrososphaera sp.]|nr:hypothetical protein [Nitrososphaera sp.]
MPVKAGGLGIRRVSDIALPAFLSSYSRTGQLQTDILSGSDIGDRDDDYLRCYTEWTVAHPDIPPPTDLSSHKQQSWDKAGVNSEFPTLPASQPDYYSKARLRAAAAPHSGDWLHALPISACGLRLDDDTVRVAVGLRLGSNLCQPHKCPCGADVDCRGAHGLSCKKSASRIMRHNYINDVVHRSLIKAGIPSSKEPNGLLSADGKRPDGLTQVPWIAGRNAV